VKVAAVFGERDEVIDEGILHCGNPSCLREYPILGGVPLLVPELRAFVVNNLLPLLGQDDLAPELESIIGDCCEPGSPFDLTRGYLSSYAWDHYGDLDPEEPLGEPRPGSVLRVLDSVANLAGDLGGPVLDLGCSVGRTTFAAAGRQKGLVLGVDLNPAMLRVAQRVLHQGRVCYPRKRVGVVYDRREFDAAFPDADRVDFWAADALSLPFAPETFGTVVGLNVLDCVASPRDLLGGARRVLRPGGTALLTTPYDWSPAATPLECWLGGHSQRGEQRGAAEPMLRALLTPGAHPQSVDGLRIVGERANLAWHVRLHDRSYVAYSVHAVEARADS
jgi:SAM-dependent methyltransferase